MNKDILSDVVELDETFITFQEQGYVKSGKRGLSADKLVITCAIDSQGHTVLSVGDRGRPLSETLISIFSEYIEEHCTLVSDSQRSYHQLVKALKVEWIKIESGDKKKVVIPWIESINYIIKSNHLYMQNEILWHIICKVI